MTNRILGRRMWVGTLAVGLVMGVASLATIDIFLPGGFVEGSDSLDVDKNEDQLPMPSRKPEADTPSFRMPRGFEAVRRRISISAP
jgi:hypothetical protein